MSPDENSPKSAVRLGPVTHFKGGRYLVFGTARHTETGELLVIYRPVDAGSVDEPDFVARPQEMFTGTVERDSQTMPRFDDTALRGDQGFDMLAVVEDVLAEGALDTSSLAAVRALIDAQRGVTVNMLADGGPGSETDVRAAVVSMLRLLDQASREVTRAEEALAR